VEGKTGYLVPLGDVDATTEALDKLLSNQEFAVEMGIKAKEDIATRWNWDNYATELLQVYAEVID
jgi:glycosyltransferase involved in cell wall biosynthesis